MSFSKNEVANLPNLITFFRILLIFPYVKLFLGENYIAALVVLAISGVSDVLDGFIARKYSCSTGIGAVLDPVADKLTLIFVIVCVSIKFQEIVPFAIILTAKDTLMLIAGGYLLKMGIKPPGAMWYGKLGTILFYAATILLVSYKMFFGTTSTLISVAFFSPATIVIIFALYKYFDLFLNLVKEKR